MKWRTKTFGEIAEFKNGLNFSPSDRGIRMKLIGVSDFQDRFRITYEDLQHVEVSGGVRKEFLLKEKDLVFVRSNGSKALVGRCLLVEKLTEPVTHSGFTIRARVTSDEADPVFVGYFFQSSVARRALAVAGGGTNISNLSQDLLSAISIPVPALAVQRKITAILGTWDQMLDKLQCLVAAKFERLRALRQQLLNGNCRFPQFRKVRWRTVRLGEVAKNVSERNQGQFNVDRLHAVTKTEGIIPMREHMKGKSQDRCKIVAINWFAYNPMRLNIGSIARWRGHQPVMVSGDYVVFRCHDQALLPDYLDQFRHSGRWATFVKATGNGSVRVRIYFDDLGRLVIPLPSVEEQTRIAAVLSACAQEIRLLEAELEALKLQKRGLMQKLLTGDIRVKV